MTHTEAFTEQERITREELVNLLNEDLAREYQAIIAYTVYSQARGQKKGGNRYDWLPPL